MLSTTVLSLSTLVPSFFDYRIIFSLNTWIVLYLVHVDERGKYLGKAGASSLTTNSSTSAKSVTNIPLLRQHTAEETLQVNPDSNELNTSQVRAIPHGEATPSARGSALFSPALSSSTETLPMRSNSSSLPRDSHHHHHHQQLHQGDAFSMNSDSEESAFRARSSSWTSTPFLRVASNSFSSPSLTPGCPATYSSSATSDQSAQQVLQKPLSPQEMQLADRALVSHEFVVQPSSDLEYTMFIASITRCSSVVRLELFYWPWSYSKTKMMIFKSGK